MVVLFAVGLNIAIFRALCIPRPGAAVRSPPAAHLPLTYNKNIKHEYSCFLHTNKCCIVFLYRLRRQLETVLLKSKWPHFSKQGIGNEVY